MIDRDTGALLLSDGPALGPRLTHLRFRASPMGKIARVSVLNPPWRSYQMKARTQHGEPAYLILYFHLNALHHIDLVVDPLAFPPGQTDFATWDEQKAWHDEWLRGCFGSPPPYEFPWGRVLSEYDPRSDCSSILILYGEA